MKKLDKQRLKRHAVADHLSGNSTTRKYLTAAFGILALFICTPAAQSMTLHSKTGQSQKQGNRMKSWHHSVIGLFAACLILTASAAFAQPMKVLWWDVSVEEPSTKSSHRQRVARFVNDYEGGSVFDVTYKFEPRRGSLARHLAAQGGYQIIVMTATNTNRTFNEQDLDALRGFYANGPKTLMLDGTLFIRNTNAHELANWPGVNGSSADLVINQMEAIRAAGGGIWIGTDHGQFQRPANQAVSAILPDARFSRTTNPSRDGEFFGEVLLANKKPVKPINILRHWESIPSQGQAPTGTFADFMGQPVTLYTLVEASDKPGGGTRRTYISSTIDPGDKRFDISGDDAPVIDRMPTRKSLPAN